MDAPQVAGAAALLGGLAKSYNPMMHSIRTRNLHNGLLTAASGIFGTLLGGMPVEEGLNNLYSFLAKKHGVNLIRDHIADQVPAAMLGGAAGYGGTSLMQELLGVKTGAVKTAAPINLDRSHATMAASMLGAAAGAAPTVFRSLRNRQWGNAAKATAAGAFGGLLGHLPDDALQGVRRWSMGNASDRWAKRINETVRDAASDPHIQSLKERAMNNMTVADHAVSPEFQSELRGRAKDLLAEVDSRIGGKVNPMIDDYMKDIGSLRKDYSANQASQLLPGAVSGIAGYGSTRGLMNLLGVKTGAFRKTAEFDSNVFGSVGSLDDLYSQPKRAPRGNPGFFSRLINKVNSAMEGVGDRIMSAGEKLDGIRRDAGQSVMDSARRGVSEAVGGIGKSVNDAVGNAANQVIGTIEQKAMNAAKKGLMYGGGALAAYHLGKFGLNQVGSYLANRRELKREVAKAVAIERALNAERMRNAGSTIDFEARKAVAVDQALAKNRPPGLLQSLKEKFFPTPQPPAPKSMISRIADKMWGRTPPPQKGTIATIGDMFRGAVSAANEKARRLGGLLPGAVPEKWPAWLK